MSRLSLWRPQKTNDYHFIDRVVNEQFMVGGTSAIIHKYIGPEESNEDSDPSRPQHERDVVDETSIQDLLLLESRDRKYEKDLYELRGIYNVSDNDFDLTQFNLFLTNDVLYMTFHLNKMVNIMGRKLMNGDVIELPHLIEEFPLNPEVGTIPKFYVVQDANRGGEGFSVTWWPHIWRVKLGPITDSQEFDNILTNVDEENSLKEMISTYNKEIEIRDAVSETAKRNDPIGGGETLTDHLYNFIKDDETDFWRVGGEVPHGDTFPSNPRPGDLFIRTDFTPDRLFGYRDDKWIRLHDNTADARTWEERTFNSATFVNNKRQNSDKIGKYDSRQSITDAILPRSDF